MLLEESKGVMRRRKNINMNEGEFYATSFKTAFNRDNLSQTHNKAELYLNSLAISFAMASRRKSLNFNFCFVPVGGEEDNLELLARRL